MPSIALLGTGLLGESIGRRLLQRGFALKVWNRDPDRCRALVQEGAVIIPSLSNSAQNIDTFITVLRDGLVTEAVVRELGDLRGSCLMPMGTMGITEIRGLAEQIQHQNGHCLEAPVLGSKLQALSSYI